MRKQFNNYAGLPRYNLRFTNTDDNNNKEIRLKFYNEIRLLFSNGKKRRKFLKIRGQKNLSYIISKIRININQNLLVIFTNSKLHPRWEDIYRLFHQ